MPLQWRPGGTWAPGRTTTSSSSPLPWGSPIPDPPDRRGARCHLIGSTRLHGDGKGGTESRWEDGDITRALRGPHCSTLSELNAAGAETLFALHGLLDRYSSLDCPPGRRCG